MFWLKFFFVSGIVLFFFFVWLAWTWKDDPLDALTPEEFKEEEAQHADGHGT